MTLPEVAQSASVELWKRFARVQCEMWNKSQGIALALGHNQIAVSCYKHWAAWEKWSIELMTFRTMYDSTTPSNIPADAQVIGYYPHAWDADISHIKAAIEVRIDNRGDHADDCHALDVEQGAADVQTAMHWVQSWNHLHPSGMHTGNGWIRKPIIYISESRLPELRTALAGLSYDLWVAHWGIGPTEIPGAFAHQYTNRGPNGENYDMSVVTDPTWGIAPAPVVTPVPAPPTNPGPPTNPTYGCVVFFNGTPTPVSRMVQSTDGGQTWH